MRNLCKFANKNFFKFSIQIRFFTTPQRMHENSTNNTRNFTIFTPPKEVQGMKILDRKMFEKQVEIPFLKIDVKFLNRILGMKAMREFTIPNMKTIKTIMSVEESESIKRISFHPDLLNNNEELKLKILTDFSHVLGETNAPKNFEYSKHLIGFEDWDVRACIKSILPPELEFKGYAQVGHIAHLNLREDLQSYKIIIAQILMDKISWVKTVVNKLDAITSKFRIFDMELLAGEPNYLTEINENGIKYKIDFSKVFWNSRLTETHKRIVDLFDQQSVVFDVFCGVGPFVLPAIKHKKVKKCFANDLNPDCIEYLKMNMQINKIPSNKIDCFVLDGGEFIRQIIPQELIKLANEEKFNENDSTEEILTKKLNFHVPMNLPGISAQFLPYFCGFLNDYPEIREFFNANPFYIHCHFFVQAETFNESREWYTKEAERIVKTEMKFPQLIIQKTRFVRKVSNRKDMFCVSFRLPTEYAFMTTTTTKESSLEQQQQQQEEAKMDSEKNENVKTDSTNKRQQNFDDEENFEEICEKKLQKIS